MTRLVMEWFQDKLESLWAIFEPWGVNLAFYSSIFHVWFGTSSNPNRIICWTNLFYLVFESVLLRPSCWFWIPSRNAGPSSSLQPIIYSFIYCFFSSLSPAKIMVIHGVCIVKHNLFLLSTGTVQLPIIVRQTCIFLNSVRMKIIRFELKEF